MVSVEQDRFVVVQSSSNEMQVRNCELQAPVDVQQVQGNIQPEAGNNQGSIQQTLRDWLIGMAGLAEVSTGTAEVSMGYKRRTNRSSIIIVKLYGQHSLISCDCQNLEGDIGISTMVCS